MFVYSSGVVVFSGRVLGMCSMKFFVIMICFE